ADSPLSAGAAYAWWDRAAAPATYWLEAVDLNGQSSWFGPLEPDRPTRDRPRVAAGPLLADLGRPGDDEARGTLLRRAGSGSPLRAAAVQVGSTLTQGKAIEISVRQEGWYHVGQPELLAAGLDPRVDPRTLHLYAEGQEQAI